MALPGRSTADVNNYLAFGVQKEKDTEATTFYFTKHLSGSGYDTESTTSNERIGGGGKEIALVYKTKVTGDGSIVTYAWPDGFARLLSNALGQDTASQVMAPASGASAGLTNHQIVANPSGTLPYLTVVQNWADERESVTNALISDLKIDGEAGKPVKVTAAFVSGGTPNVHVASQVVAREAGDPLMVPGASAVFTWAGGGASGGTTSQITKYTLDIKNGLDTAIQTLSLFREDVVFNTIDNNLDLTVKYVNNAAWNEVKYGGGTQVPIKVPTGAFTFFTAQQSSGGSLSAELKLPFVTIGNAKVNRLDPDGKTMYIDFTTFTTTNAATANSVIGNIITTATLAYTNEKA